ncbi:NYN domain-containing protein [Shimia sp. MIT1388]|uniref:NYN domain-containing protein n=1 Tax=Shimia sp. MIT1388 TaxID=3096992 RepID=UPI00399A1496
MTNRTRPLLAILIDADNIPAKHAAAILKEITALGEPALRRVYGDWASPSLQSWLEPVRTLGLVAHQESANTKGKNASDIGLVIDAMDILHSGRFDGFVLVSSDSDFTALASRIREQGLSVFGIGEQKTPESLRNVCNRFILVENIVEPEPKPATDSATSGKRPTKEAAPLIRAAMEKIDQDDEWFSLGQIGQKIAEMQSDFDSRTYGHAKLSDLVKSLNQFKTRRSGGNGNPIQVALATKKS